MFDFRDFRNPYIFESDDYMLESDEERKRKEIQEELLEAMVNNDEGLKRFLDKQEEQWWVPEERARPRDIEIEDLELCETIAKGGFGVVKKAVYDGEEVAVKISTFYTARKKEYDVFLAALKETLLLNSLDDKHVVRIVGMGVNWKSYEHLMVMEYLPEDLHSFVDKKTKKGGLSLSEQKRIMFQMVRGVEVLHSNGIIHNDLKPKNFLVDKQDNVKIADLGLSYQRANPTGQTSVAKKQSFGTPMYTAPEIIAEGRSSYASDIFSLGMCFFFVATQQEPVLMGRGREPNTLINLGHRPPLPSHIKTQNPKLVKLIEWCWDHDPKKRPKLEEIYNYLRRV